MNKYILIMLAIMLFIVQSAAYTFTKEEEAERANMLIFADKLEKAEPYSMFCTNPFVEGKYKMEIKGIVDGKCIFIQELPGDSRMEGRLSESSRKTIAKYYRDIINARTQEVNVKAHWGNNEDTVNAVHKINGKIVKDPIDECLKNGELVIKVNGEILSMEY